MQARMAAEHRVMCSSLNGEVDCTPDLPSNQIAGRIPRGHGGGFLGSGQLTQTSPSPRGLGGLVREEKPRTMPQMALPGGLARCSSSIVLRTPRLEISDERYKALFLSRWSFQCWNDFKFRHPA